MITAVVLNWARPDNLKHHVLPLLCDHPLVTETIICHCKSETQFQYHHTETTVINLDYAGYINDTYGMSCRFLAANSATNQCILMLDDDVLPNHSAINFLYEKHLKFPRIIVGKWGRNPTKDYAYQRRRSRGPSAIILTKFMMFNITLSRLFFKYSGAVEKLQLSAKPLWNGEDIFLSLVALKHNIKPNMAYPDLPLETLPSDDMGISSWADHRRFRTRLLRVASIQLGLLDRDDLLKILNRN